jgi:hypothetical protein
MKIGFFGFVMVMVVMLSCHVYGAAVPVFTPGANEDEEAIFPSGIQEGPDGNIYIYDMKDSFIKVYSPSGKFLRKMCGPGEGPGFIKRAEGVRFGFTPEKKIYITEYFGGHPWITILNPDGKLDKTIPIKIPPQVFGVQKSMMLSDGRFLLEIAFLGETQKKNKYYVQASPTSLYLIDSKGNPVSKIKSTNYYSRISFLKLGGDIELPFCPFIRWQFFKGNTVIFTDGLSKDLSMINLKGEFIGTIKTPIPGPQPVTKEDMKKWREGIKEQFSITEQDRNWYKEFGKVAEDYDGSIYNRKVCIGTMSVTPEGNILIACPSAKAENSDYWLLNPKGEKITTVTLNFGVSMTKSFMILHKKDDDGNSIISCYPRKGKEKDDLNSMRGLL